MILGAPLDSRTPSRSTDDGQVGARSVVGKKIYRRRACDRSGQWQGGED